MAEQISQRERRLLASDRFVDAATVTDAFRHAPRLDWATMRDDVDAIVDQDAIPCG